MNSIIQNINNIIKIMEYKTEYHEPSVHFAGITMAGDSLPLISNIMSSRKNESKYLVS